MAHLSTINADGSPQVGVIWIELDGDDLGSGHMGRPMADPRQLGGFFFPEPPSSAGSLLARRVQLLDG
jgi:hypothetical protein